MQVFSRLAACASTCATCAGIMLRPLARAAAPQLDALGVELPLALPLDLSACRELAPQLRTVAAAVSGCCEALAGVLGRGAAFEVALAQLRALEAR